MNKSILNCPTQHRAIRQIAGGDSTNPHLFANSARRQNIICRPRQESALLAT